MATSPTLHLSPDPDTQATAARILEALQALAEEMRARTHADSAALSEALNPLMDAVLHARTMATAPATYYEPPDREHLFNLDVDAAVLSHLEDDYDTPEDFPETITINRFRRMVPKARSFRHPNHLSPLTEILERLDEDHADPEGPATDPTPAMLRTEAQMIETVLMEYNPHWYEVTSSLTVHVRTWLASHCPDLMPIRSFQKAVCGHCRTVRGAQEMRSCTACRRRGCSRCWRRALSDPTPWAIRHRRYGCAFRLTDEQEKDKIRREYQNHTEHLGWGFRPEGPVHAE